MFIFWGSHLASPFYAYIIIGGRMTYTIQFSGKKVKSNKFKSDLHSFVQKSVTRFFDFDGETLKADLTNEEKERVEFFVGKYGGQTIIIE